MDPKQGQLDPTLKAAYDKVMGTNEDQSASSASPTTPVAPIIAPNPNPAPAPVTSSTGDSNKPSFPEQTNPATPAAPTPTEPLTPPPAPALPDTMQQTMAIPQMPQVGVATIQPQTVKIDMQAPTTTKAKAKGKGKVSPVIYIFAGIAFFIVYVLFWIRIFNIPIPFLPH